MELATSQLILQSCRIAYFVTDRDLNVLESGGALDALCGDHEAALGRSLMELVPEFVGSESSLADVSSGRLPQFQLELVNRSAPEGDTCYMTLTALPYAGQRTDAAMLIVASDTSREAGYVQTLNQTRNELRLTCREIAGERGRLRALMQSNRDGIVFVGTDLRVQFINTPAIQICHLPGRPERWVTRSILDVLTALRRHAPAVARVGLAEMRRLQAMDGPPGEGECESPPRVVHWLNLPVLADAAPLGRLLVLQDVTEQRRLEQMRDDLVHSLVHDLRNPLAAIALSLQLLEVKTADDLSPDLRRTLANARNSTFVMSDLVDNILDMSRLESGQMPLRREAVPMADLVTRVLRTQSLLASYKDLALESDVSPALSDAWADAGMIERVLQNLLRNAIKFTPPGGWVRVAAGQGDGGRDSVAPRYVWVTVADNGPGIPAEVQGRLFQKFAAGQQMERGSGIGLAFCKLAVEAHGGRITVESEPERGTAFTFTLPIAPGATLAVGGNP